MFIYKRFLFSWVWVVVTLWGSAAIVFNSRIYFISRITPSFLLEKGVLVDDTLWYTSFRFHVVASCVCLLVGAAIMLDSNLRFRRLHTILGNLYVCLTLWVVVPSGMVMAPFAKGGTLAAIGFAFTGLALWISTWAGYQSIQKGNVNSHIAWMVRSYAISLSAVFFRIIQLVLVGIGMGNTPAYIAAVWLSLFTSIAVAEFCVLRQFPDQLLVSTNFSNSSSSSSLREMKV